MTRPSIGITNARAELAKVLWPEDGHPTDARVLADPADAVVAPCYMLNWRTPAIENWGACRATGVLTALLIGGRIEIAGAVGAIEQMYDRLQVKVRNAAGGWTIQTDSGIIVVALGGVQYLACRIDIAVPIELDGQET